MGLMQLALEDQVNPLWAGATPKARRKSIGERSWEEAMRYLLDEQGIITKKAESSLRRDIMNSPQR
jgi:hypothetical protein